MPTSIVSPTMPVVFTIPAYAYQQYADDPNVVAFFDAYNALAQQYTDWSNDVSLAVYTGPLVSGALLDWIGQGIYGVPRPVFSTLSTTFTANAVGEVGLTTMAVAAASTSSSGSAQTANDDYYKRVLTYLTYTGDGHYSNMMTWRKRIARFLYGFNGGDINPSLVQNVDIAAGSANAVTITLPAGESSSFFAQGFSEGFLVFPFMLNTTVVVL